MSERSSENQDVGSPAVSVPIPAGQLLREAREAQGLHLGALAVALKVPVKKLEALEACRYEQLPDMVFVRALALSVCRALKIDSMPIMASLPQLQASPFKSNEANLNTTFTDSARGARSTAISHLISPIGLGVLLLVTAMVVVLMWPVRNVTDSSTVDLTSQGNVAAQQSFPPVAGASENTAALATTIGKPIDPATPLAVAALEQGSMPLVALIEFSARGVTWVEVTDAAGQSKLRKLTNAGEVLRVSGQPPLSVVVGRADQVAVFVRGKPLDILPLTKDNVARFEVK